MTTLRSLDEHFEVNDAIREAFAEQGFVKLSNVLSRETIESLEPEITSKVIELNTQHLPMEERSTYDKAFLQVGQLRFHSAAARAFVFSRKLAAIAADLLGTRGVRLYTDQALYKEPGGGITPWHADQYYWPLASDRTCTVWIPLQDTTPQMGPLSFAVGSQKLSVNRDLPISDESESAIQAAVAAHNFPLFEEPFELGDVSYHLGWTFHRASPNRSDEPRRVMTVIYMDIDMIVSEPQNSAQVNDLRTAMPGAEPGAVPNTPNNPVLFVR